MGEPAMRWKDPDGREQLAYPRGAVRYANLHGISWGRTVGWSISKVCLDMEHFARIRTRQVAIRRKCCACLGPPQPQWTAYFKARDELVWEWRFCDSWNALAFFDVLFDATTGVVRSSYQRSDLRGPDGRAPSCAH